MSTVSLPVTRPTGRALLVGSVDCRQRPLTLLQGMGYFCVEADDPYCALVELSRRPQAYRALILSLQSVYREELPLISTVKKRFPQVEIWLTDTDGRQASLADAMGFGADGLLGDDGLHRVAIAVPAQISAVEPATPARPGGSKRHGRSRRARRHLANHAPVEPMAAPAAPSPDPAAAPAAAPPGKPVPSAPSDHGSSNRSGQAPSRGSEQPNARSQQPRSTASGGAASTSSGQSPATRPARTRPLGSRQPPPKTSGRETSTDSGVVPAPAGQAERDKNGTAVRAAQERANAYLDVDDFGEPVLTAEELRALLHEPTNEGGRK